MKPLIRLKNLLSLGLCVFSLAAIAAPGPGKLTPASLRCEYLVNPLGIDSPKPRLTWILQSSDPAVRGMAQRGYQVLVASSPAVLAQDLGDLWDSGQVKSDDTANIVYTGLPLISREICYWKVRSWDSSGNSGAWSEPASWEMGLLRQDDWLASWIDAPTVISSEPIRGEISILGATYGAKDAPDAGADVKDVTDIVRKMLRNKSLEVQVSNEALKGDPAFGKSKQLRVSYSIDGVKHEATAAEGSTLSIPDKPQAVHYLRKDFIISKPVAKARLYATSLGLYELHMNGRRVGDHIFAPDWTDYSKRVRYQVYDVTSLVEPGDNTLAGLVGKGWYCGHIGNGGFQAWGKVPALFAQLEITYADGTTDHVVTDASWKIHTSPVISSDFMLGENYDARQEIAGWDQPGLDVNSWATATERDEASRALDVQVDQPVRETGELRPKSMSQPAPGQYTYDFGQNMVGFIRLRVSAPAGTKLTLRHAEMLNKDGSLYTTNLRGAPSIDTYICKGGATETWQPHFTFHGFRYVELTGLPQAPADGAVTGIVIGSDIQRTGEFSCSNPAVNQLQSNIQWGMRGNYLAVPTDCPQRDERLGWMGDAQVFIHTAAYNGDIAAFFTKWLVDVDDAQAADGAFTNIAPCPAGTGSTGVPAWSDAGVICPWTIYLMYGDTRILEQHLPAMKRWVDWCQAHSTGLLRDRDRGHDYGDWLSQGEDAPKDMIGTAYFAYTASLLAKAYCATGDIASATKYEQLFGKIKDAFNKNYVSADGHIKGGTQCGYCMALRFDLLPPDLRPKAAQYLEDNVKNHDNHLTTGFIGVSYLLPALCSQNKIETAYRLLLQDTFPSWLFSVKHGATTIWERWDGWTPEKGFQNPGMNSFNHYSLGSCGEWMFDTVAGIGVDPTRPGFSHIIIHPGPGGDLTSAKGSFDSIHGKISTDWSLRDGSFTLHVIIPVNTTATITLPTANPSTIQESGAGIQTHREIKLAGTSPDGAQYRVGSGDYTFTCKVP
ncbi:MAG: family 78 glycoside hydrolase catalytic domain [Chthoniobacteraceae bacterium]